MHSYAEAQKNEHEILAFCLCFYCKLGMVTWFISMMNSLSSEVEQDDLPFRIFK